MRYLSVCSGIEAATVAWHHMGWQPVAFSEIEPFPSAVLAHHYPDVPNVGDMTKFKEWNLESIDLLVGGTPCQSFSVAGLRKGLNDPRGNLMLTFLAIAERHRPRWIVWENVSGVLSSNGGRDFGTFLAALGELGYGWAYRVLDAQWFGVAQRRRRVFVVGCLGDQAGAAAVLFESESVCRNPAPSREKGQGVARGVSDGFAYGIDEEQNASRELFGCLKARTAGGGFEGTVAQPVAFHHNAQTSQLPTDARDTSISDALTTSQQAAVALPVAFSRNDDGRDATLDLAPTMRVAGRAGGMLGVAQSMALGTDCYNGAITGEVAATIGTPGSSVNASGPTVMVAVQVRRLTPTECERLQGFPDGYTNIPWRKKDEAPDGPRYKALGNSMAVPCMRWIGERIAKVTK
jgi:DNA (cytosine-5)-methyltransferase 1